MSTNLNNCFSKGVTWVSRGQCKSSVGVDKRAIDGTIHRILIPDVKQITKHKFKTDWATWSEMTSFKTLLEANPPTEFSYMGYKFRAPNLANSSSANPSFAGEGFVDATAHSKFKRYDFEFELEMIE